MTMNDDLIRDLTGAPDGIDEKPEPPRMFVGARFVNSIEAELTEQLTLELQGFMPTIFIDGDTGELDEIHGGAEPWRKIL